MITAEQVAELIEEVRTRSPSDYRKGYLDALMYILDWMEEDE